LNETLLTKDNVVNTELIRGWISEAADIARFYFKHTQPDWKGIADPVTEADRAIERLLVERISTAFPDHGIVGEEYGIQALDREYLWTVDPIDGTRVYVEGLPTWTITIAMLHNRVPEFGLVYIPMIDDWTYTEGDDVINNGVSIRDCLKQRWDLDSYIMARSDANAWLDIQFTRVTGLGSTAAHFAYMARGAAVATVLHGAFVWDIAAGAAILRKQGGEIRLESGELIDFSTLNLTQRIEPICFAGHPDVVRRLRPLIQWREKPAFHPDW
jgi:myo-inositol-1(or 4)-monophosphatase